MATFYLTRPSARDISLDKGEVGMVADAAQGRRETGPVVIDHDHLLPSVQECGHQSGSDETCTLAKESVAGIQGKR